MTGNQTTEAAPVFAALGDETRLRLVARMSAEGPLSITQLATGSHVTRQAVTKHLHVLAAAGVARSRRSGRQRLWELDPDGLRDARTFLERVSAEWDVALSRLQRLVEQDESSTSTPDVLSRNL